MFINFTNHPSTNWDDTQINASIKYGKILDIPFPLIEPLDSREQIQNLASYYVNKICLLRPVAVLVQGEMTFCYEVVKELKKHNILTLCACSNRDVIEGYNSEGETVKEAIFSFVQYREY